VRQVLFYFAGNARSISQPVKLAFQRLICGQDRNTVFQRCCDPTVPEINVCNVILNLICYGTVRYIML